MRLEDGGGPGFYSTGEAESPMKKERGPRDRAPLLWLSRLPPCSGSYGNQVTSQPFEKLKFAPPLSLALQVLAGSRNQN